MPQYNDENEKIIRLFKQLPIVHDDRQMENIYKRIKTDMHTKQKQKRHTFVPILSTVAGILIIIILFPAIFNRFPQLDSESGSLDHDRAESEMSVLDNKSGGDHSELKLFSDEEDTNTNDDYVGKTAVYEADLQSSELYTFGVVTNDAIAIPISLLKPKDEGHLSKFEKYKQVSDSFEEADYGFQDISPLIDSIKIEKQTDATIFVNEDTQRLIEDYQHQLVNLLQYSLRDQGIHVVHIRNEQGNPIEIGEFGVMENIRIKPLLERGYYLYLVNGYSYLVPADMESENMSEAIIAMKTAPNDFYQSVIPEDINPVVLQEDDNMVKVGFKENLDLNQGDQLKMINMIEGILLTAKEFGFEFVMFENIKQQQWEGFNFDSPVKVPYAENRLE